MKIFILWVLYVVGISAWLDQDCGFFIRDQDLDFFYFFTHTIISNFYVHFHFFFFWILYLLHYNNILLLFFYNHFHQTQSFHDKSLKLILSKLYLLMFKFSKFYTKLFLEHSLFWSRLFFQLILYLLFCDNTSHFLFLQSFY